MTRRIVIVGLIVLAALLPLAPPPAMFVLEVAFVAIGAALVAVAIAPSPAPLRLAIARAPPSR